MQKQVSKRGISILALSILLILSLGLTATFAAFKTSGSTTGTVTFNDTIAITDTTGKTIDVSIDVGGTNAVTFGNAATQLSTATITADGATFYWQVTLEITAGYNFFTFDSASQLNGVSGVISNSDKTITWTGASGVAAQQTFTIGTMLAGLGVDLDTEAIGGYDGTPTGTLTLTIMAQYHAFA